MRSMLKAFAALVILALPAGLPTYAFAQDQDEDRPADVSPPPNDSGARHQPDAPPERPVRDWAPEAPAYSPPVQETGPDSSSRYDANPAGDPDSGRQNAGDQNRDFGYPRSDAGGWDGRDNGGDHGGGWDRGDNAAAEWNRGGQDDPGANGAEDWTRGAEERDPETALTGGPDFAPPQDEPQRVAPRGSFADSCSGSYVNQGRLYADCRDTRGNIRGTSIELARCSSSDIGNDNGRLVCHNVRGDFEDRGGDDRRWDRGWDRYNGGDRYWNDRNGWRDYGDFRNRWNQNDWRREWNRSRSYDWWRNDRGFRGYRGYRFGFYFAPGYGYYSVPRNYWGQRYYVGSYLPSIFWRYQLNDWRTYGLGYPPAGTQWVVVDNTIYLIDRYDGYIIDAIYDAWRW